MKLKGKKFLFIDDEEVLLFAYRYLVEAEGAEVHTATDLDSTLALVKTHQFDYVISDFNMPMVTGYEVLVKVREFNSSAKLFIISGTVNIDYLKKADTHNILSGTLEKPFTREKLLSLFA